ncbi:hypothetical protein FOL47_001979 [Perkinsus chesapeaki]|uniref:Uncharacterized protein n=1 Tax=Perkinsus chesapeaki TaxID=330153 RepID=A0A7J6N0J6_PERCH|nr:hypothetical protein FOL47_001979 [Perkinsus chesapeaki]
MTNANPITPREAHMGNNTTAFNLLLDTSNIGTPSRSTTTPFNVNAAEFVPLSARKPSRDKIEPSNRAPLNVNAPVFIPGANSDPVVGNGDSRLPIDPSERVKAEICQIIHSMGMTGVRVTQLPHQYRRCTGKWLILSDTKFATLSDVIDDIKSRIEFIDTPGRSSPDRHASGTTITAPATDKKLIVEPSGNAPGAAACPPLVIGHHADRIVMDKYFGHYSEELNFFRQLVVAVVRDFCLRNLCSADANSSIDDHSSKHPSIAPHQRPAGLALSLFAAEWDRYFHGTRGLKEMRERFGVMKLMPFLHSIKELDIVGTHPEVRVRMKPEYLYSSTPVPAAAGGGGGTGFHSNPETIGGGGGYPLDGAPPPGFGNKVPDVKAGRVVSSGHQTETNGGPEMSAQARATAMLARELLQSQQQLMAIITQQQEQLALIGNTQQQQQQQQQPVPAMVNEWDTVLSGLMATMNSSHTSPAEIPGQQGSVAPAKGIPGDAAPVAVTSAASALISKDDLKQLLLSVVEGACAEQARAWDAKEDFLSVLTATGGEESDSSCYSSSNSDCGNSDISFRRTEMDAKLASFGGKVPEAMITVEREKMAQSKRNKTVGMPVSSVKRSWKRAYPSLNPLDFYMTYFGIRKLKFLLLEIPQLLLIGSGGSMRVATFAHTLNYCNPFPADCRSGTTTLDSDEAFAGKNGLRQQLHKLLFDLIADKCQEQQMTELRTRATLGDTEAKGLLKRYSQAGESLSKAAEKAKDGGVQQQHTVEGMSNGSSSSRGSRPAPIDTAMSSTDNREDGGVEEVWRAVPEPEGVAISDVEGLWRTKYGKELGPLLEMAGYRNASRLIHTCPGLRVFGHGVCMRCRVGKKASLSPKTVDTRPSIITPETVPLPPTPIRAPSAAAGPGAAAAGVAKTPLSLAENLFGSVEAIGEQYGIDWGMHKNDVGSICSSYTPPSGGIFQVTTDSSSSSSPIINQTAAIGSLYSGSAQHEGADGIDATAAAVLDLLSMTSNTSTPAASSTLYPPAHTDTADNTSFLQQSPMLSIEGLLAEVDTPPTRTNHFGVSPINEGESGILGQPGQVDDSRGGGQEVTPMWKGGCVDPEDALKSLKAAM